MKEITDEFMKEMMLKTKEYTIVILKATEKIKEQNVNQGHKRVTSFGHEYVKKVLMLMPC